jgi:transcriptional regulator with XRE-family HTH domain
MSGRQVPANVRSALANAVSKLRERDGMNQTEMGKKLGGLTQQAITKTEAGDGGPTVLRNFLGAYAMSEADLLREFGEAGEERSILEQVLDKYADVLTYQQSKDLQATAALKGITYAELDAVALRIAGKSAKNIELVAVDASHYAPVKKVAKRK